MTSEIDPTKPDATSPTTASVRANFQTAVNEIEELQEISQWQGVTHTATFATTTTFTVATDLTAKFTPGREIECVDATTLYGIVISSSYAAPDTTVTVELATGDLSSSLTVVSLSVTLEADLFSVGLGASADGKIIINGATSNDAILELRENNVSKWSIGNDGSDSDKLFIRGASGAADQFVTFDQNGAVILSTKLEIINDNTQEVLILAQANAGAGGGMKLQTDSNDDGLFQLYDSSGAVKVQFDTDGGDSYISLGDFGVGTSSMLGKLHIDQFSGAGAKPVLYLDQADLSEVFIRFVCVEGVDNAVEDVGAKTLTTTKFLRINVNGTDLYLQGGTIA